jgi:hypothetical protein
MSSTWLWAGAAAIVVVTLLGVWWWRRRSRDEFGRALAAVAVAWLRDVLVPDGMGGHIHVANLLLTARGLVVVDVKPFRGVIFASDRMEEWTVIADRRRFAFPNPQSALYDRVAAVRALAKELPVAGHVMFGAGADFTKGRPKDIISSSELVAHYAKPEGAELARLLEAFEPHWERVKDAIRAGH